LAVLLLAFAGCSPSADENASSNSAVDLDSQEESARKLEQQGYGPVAEIEIEDEWWEN
jgi:hypothetical protein